MGVTLVRESEVTDVVGDGHVASDAQRFEAFYAAHRSRLYRALALALRDNSLAAEATDEAFTRAYERWSDVAGYANPAGWIYRVGMNWATSSIRKRRRETVGDPTDQATIDEDVTDPRLVAAIAGLSLEHRSVIIMRYFLDWSTDDMAEALDVAPGTVKSRLHRALAALATAVTPLNPYQEES
jgi:RNA polymerase sigma-70 factor (ECF subfamily)